MMTTQQGIYQTFHIIKNCYERIVIDLSRQTNMNIPQENNFVEKLEEDDGATMLFISFHKTVLSFSLDSLIVTE